MIIARFRAEARDIGTDAGRLLPIRGAVAVALGDAQAELAGLTKRFEEATSRAAFLFGDEIASDTDQDPTADTQLSKLEGFLVRGQTRQRYLQRQILALQEIAEQLDSMVAPQTS